MNTEAAGVDLLVVAAHTDDAEIALGGTLRLLSTAGRRIWVCDLTRGELATNATPDERWAEAAAASARLGLSGRLQLGLPDGFLSPEDPGQTSALVAVIRRLCPRWLAVAPESRRHPDHRALPPLATRAAFLANLSTLQPAWPETRTWPGDLELPEPAERWRPEALLETCAVGEEPSLIFDVSTTWEDKLAALACYRSQFRREPGRRPTMLNDPTWPEEIERRGRHWGFRAQVAHGEALRGRVAPVLRDLPPEVWA